MDLDRSPNFIPLLNACKIFLFSTVFFSLYIFKYLFIISFLHASVDVIASSFHTHEYMHMCVCVYIYIYIYNHNLISCSVKRASEFDDN